MDLSVEVKLDLDSTISITDYTIGLGTQYLSETSELLTSYDKFRYSDTCTIDVIKYQPSSGEELIDTIFTEHDESLTSDSIRIPLDKDGYYTVDHIVLPTTDWLESVKDQDLTPYSYIYVTDGHSIYKYTNSALTSVDVNEVILINSTDTTISIKSFDVFNTAALLSCYISISKKLLENCQSKCESVYSNIKFNRDFIWMTYNVIKYYVDDDKYAMAQIILENVTTCYQFCSENTTGTNSLSSCSCNQ